jgi:hypothetical protein
MATYGKLIVYREKGSERLPEIRGIQEIPLKRR